ncbi:Heterokaryon incompatibility protein [Pyrenophora tritici-repentis]|nr:Heterokaryon incompatibility protein [Pyrenophora tritici-repentis]
MSSWFEDLHRDLYELMECSNHCSLCKYVCNLFGQTHLNRFLARVAEYNSKLKQLVDQEAAKEMRSGKTGYRSSQSLSRAPQATPTVSIQCNASDSHVDPDGKLDRVVVCIRLEHHVSELWEDKKVFMLYSEAGRAFLRAIWGNAKSIDIRSRSATIRTWLNECQTNHATCRDTIESNSPIAARILAVQEYETNKFLIKLVSTEKVNLRIEPHLVLSHVWGTIDMACKTTRSNISDYQTVGIEFDILTKTFQDTIRITAAMGFQYVWIDSLCIIQNDKDDWERESAKMAAIFHMSTITLSATSAENGHGGCGLTKDSEKTIRFSDMGGRGPDFAARETATISPNPSTMINNQLRYAPVNKRAWILQEQQLSRRILHAMDSQLVWECGVFTESEDGILYKQGKTRPKARSRNSPESLRLSQRQRPYDEAAPHLGVYESAYRWWRCVEDYSTRFLTVPADQYAALAGIVHFHQESTGDIPVVGLWEQYLALHLGWAVYHDPYEHTTPQWNAANRRPSWTWMSFQHGSVRIVEPILWPILREVGSREGDLGIIYQALILHTDVRWSSQPLTSDPAGSTIRIRGMMHRRPRPKPVRAGIRSPLHLDPGVTEPSDRIEQYEALALFAYVQSATLKNQPPYITTTYLIVKATGLEDKDEYMRIGRMQLTEPFNMDLRHTYLPEGTRRDIVLV